MSEYNLYSYNFQNYESLDDTNNFVDDYLLENEYIDFNFLKIENISIKDSDQLLQKSELCSKNNFNQMPNPNFEEDLNKFFNGNKKMKLPKKVIEFVYNLIKKNPKYSKWQDITANDMRRREDVFKRIYTYSTEILRELTSNRNYYLIQTMNYIKEKKNRANYLKFEKLLTQSILKQFKVNV